MEIKQHAQGQIAVYQLRIGRGAVLLTSLQRWIPQLLKYKPATAAFIVLSTIITLNCLEKGVGETYLTSRLILECIFLNYT